MGKTIEQVQKELDESIPRSAVQERAAFTNGPKLSYLAGWYVIDRLNKIFGQGNWCYRTASLIKTFEGEVNGKFYVSYTSLVHLIVIVDGRSVEFSDVGFGDGQDKSNPGKAHELAVKEAVTDGIKRCAKSLGMSLGLALYDKTQEFVSDEERPNNAAGNSGARKENTTEPAKAINSGHGNRDAVGGKGGDATREHGAYATGSVGSTPAQQPTTRHDYRATREIIKAAVKVLNAKGTLKIADFKSKYGVNKLDELNEAATIDLYAKLKHDYPEVQLN